MREYLGGETPVFATPDSLAKAYPFFTPYQFAGNMPIRFIDLDGGEPIPVEGEGELEREGEGEGESGARPNRTYEEFDRDLKERSQREKDETAGRYERLPNDRIVPRPIARVNPEEFEETIKKGRRGKGQVDI